MQSIHGWKMVKHQTSLLIVLFSPGWSNSESWTSSSSLPLRCVNSFFLRIYFCLRTTNVCYDSKVFKHAVVCRSLPRIFLKKKSKGWNRCLQTWILMEVDPSHMMSWRKDWPDLDQSFQKLKWKHLWKL